MPLDGTMNKLSVTLGHLQGKGANLIMNKCKRRENENNLTTLRRNFILKGSRELKHWLEQIRCHKRI